MATTPTDLPSFPVAHLSDTHLGYEAYIAKNSGNENQRAADFVRAFVNVCQDIISEDPPLVIHSGDVADHPHIPIRFMLVIRQWFSKLAGTRPDGTRRQLVVVAGNHEIPRQKREACFLELFKEMPGVHIATKGYEVFGFTGDCDPRLRDVLVHAIPHDALREVDFDTVNPVEGKVNIFSSHGVAGGSELYVRSLGKEFAIPTDVLLRPWDYGALGHWHKQGPIPLVGATGVSKKVRDLERARVMASAAGAAPNEAETGRIWYAGSTENSGFGDLRDNGQRRGWLLTQVNPGLLPLVRRRFSPIRQMYRLPHLDASGMAPDQITQALKDRLAAQDVAGAVIGQVVDGVTRETWSMVDISGVRQCAVKATHYQLDAHYLGSSKEERAAKEATGLGEIGLVMDERAAAILTKSQIEPALTLAKDLVRRAFEASVAGAPKDQAADADVADAVQATQPEPEPEPATQPEPADAGLAAKESK